MTLCEVRTKGDITIVVMPLQIDHVAALTLDHELHELAIREPKALFLRLFADKIYLQFRTPDHPQDRKDRKGG